MKNKFIITISIIILLVPCSLIAQWVLQNSGTTSNLVEVSVVSDNIAWAVGGGTSVFTAKTTNGGLNWTILPSTGIDPLSEILTIAAFDENTAVIGTNQYGFTAPRRIYRTTNGGQSWSSVFPLKTFINGIKALDANTGYFHGDPVGNRFEFYRTTNKGATWDSAGLYIYSTGGETGSVYSLAVNSNAISFGTTTNAVYFSTNGGYMWTRKTVPADFSGIGHTHFINNMNGIAGDTYLLYRTTNGGTNWNKLPFNGIHIIQGISGHGNHVWVGRRYVIYYTSNFGSNWVRQDSSTANIGLWDFDGRYFNGKMNMWGVGASGRISHNAVPINISKISEMIPDKFSLGQNYPNPFNGRTKFSVSIPERKNVEIKIFDNNGRLVRVLMNSELLSGIYDITVNTDGLTSGIYYYSLKAGNFTETKKFVLMK